MEYICINFWSVHVVLRIVENYGGIGLKRLNIHRYCFRRTNFLSILLFIYLFVI